MDNFNLKKYLRDQYLHQSTNLTEGMEESLRPIEVLKAFNSAPFEFDVKGRNGETFTVYEINRLDSSLMNRLKRFFAPEDWADLVADDAFKKGDVIATVYDSADNDLYFNLSNPDHPVVGGLKIRSSDIG